MDSCECNIMSVRKDVSVRGKLRTNYIEESTAGAGVVIDGLLIKDGAIPSLPPATIPDPLLANIINERTGGSGVTVEGVVLDTGTVEVTSTSQTTAYTNGALVVAGGVGVAKDLRVNGNVRSDTIEEGTTGAGVTIDGLLIKDGAIPGLPPASVPDPVLVNTINERTMGTGVTVEGVVLDTGTVEVTSTAESTAHTNGALVVAGGVGVAKDLRVNGAIFGCEIVMISHQGEAYIAAASARVATTFSASSTWTPLLANATMDIGAGGITLSHVAGAPVITYSVSERHMFIMDMSLSVTSGANNKTYEFAIGRDNGSGVGPIESSIQGRKQGTGADKGTISMGAMFTMEANNTICIMVRNMTDTVSLTAENLNIRLRALNGEELVQIPPNT